jgi:hypothetical protein
VFRARAGASASLYALSRASSRRRATATLPRKNGKRRCGKAAANAKVTIESLIAEAEAARTKAMSEKGGAAAVSALTAKAKLAGMWREKVDTHNTGQPVYERIERTIVEHHAKPTGQDRPVDERRPQEFETPTNGRHWSS